jgi:hypothetical protein
VPALEGVRQLILGSVFSNGGQEIRAKACYLEAIRHGEACSDVHAAAFAAYELGMLLCRNHEVGQCDQIGRNCNILGKNYSIFIYYTKKD